MSLCSSCEQLCSHLPTRPGIGRARIELCSLFTRIWSVHCVWRLHTLGAGPHHLDPLANRGEIAFYVTRFYLALPHCHSQYGRVTRRYAHYLHAFGRYIACGGSTHSALDRSTSIHSQIWARLRFQSRDLISRRPTATHSMGG